MGFRIICLSVLLTLSTSVSAQEFAAIFDIEGPITRDCERQFPIEHVARIVVFWDYDQNGRSEGDSPVPVYTYPEHSQANLYEFYTDSSDGVQSPVYLAFLQNGDLPNFYLCLYPWPGEEVEWVSPNFTLTPHDYFDPETVGLPFDLWTCGEHVLSTPSCTPEPDYIYVPSPPNWPEPSCVRICPSTGMSIWMGDEDTTDFNAYRLPTILVRPGCDRDLPARAELAIAYIWYSPYSGYNSFRIVADEFGYATVEMMDYPPCATVDTFTVERGGASVRIRWNTLAELNLSHFEIWSDHAIGPSWLRHVADVPAQNVWEGATYEYFEVGPVEDHYKWYTLVLVADDSLRYPNMRAYLPWATDASDLPAVVVSPSLIGNFPNPFNSETRIEFELPNESSVTLEVYDLAGRLVQTLLDERMSAGEHSASFRGENLASGIYFVRLTAGSFQSTHKMILLK